MTYEELLAVGIQVSQEQHRLLAEFLRLLRDENQTHNLTGIRDERDMWALHVCDSLALLPLIDAAISKPLDARAPCRLLDIGTGGGSPGIPVACMRPDWTVTLLDATRKKVDAVGRFVTALGLANARTEWGRAEMLGGAAGWSGGFDAVTARAVASLDRLVNYAGPFLRSGGRAFFFKSRGVDAEIAAARTQARRRRLSFAAKHAYTLPAPHGQRVIVEFVKSGG